MRLTIRIGKAPEYKLNGAQATQSDVNELRKYYNIQVLYVLKTFKTGTAF